MKQGRHDVTRRACHHASSRRHFRQVYSSPHLTLVDQPTKNNSSHASLRIRFMRPIQPRLDIRLSLNPEWPSLLHYRESRGRGPLVKSLVGLAMPFSFCQVSLYANIRRASVFANLRHFFTTRRSATTCSHLHDLANLGATPAGFITPNWRGRNRSRPRMFARGRPLKRN